MMDFIERSFGQADPEYLAGIVNGQKPHVVCLCGSTRFRADFEHATKLETLRGHAVLSVGMFCHEDGLDPDGPVKAMLDALHFRKIDMSNEVLIVNTGGYVGKSTSNEIAYATSRGKPIRYLYPANVPSGNK
jgi:hypothetical protein